MYQNQIQADDELFHLAERLAGPVPPELAEIVIAMCDLMPAKEWRRSMMLLYRPRDAKIMRT